MKNRYIIHDFMVGVLVAHITLPSLKNAFCWLSTHDSWPCELKCISSEVQSSHWKQTLAAFPTLREGEEGALEPNKTIVSEGGKRASASGLLLCHWRISRPMVSPGGTWVK